MKKSKLKVALCLCTVSLLHFTSAPRLGASSALANEYLMMDISQLLNVTITSVSKKPQKISQAAAAVFVITQEDIRRSGVTSVADALAMAPGLQVAQISSSQWSVSSRGFAGYTSNKLLVLIDGRTVYSPAYSGTFWSMQNTLLEDIDRIEVIRGPGGTLWGANAVNGVINIITKNSDDTQQNIVRVAGGNQEQLLGGLRVGTKLSDTVSGRLALSFADRAENSLHMGNQGANDDWRHMQASFRVDGTPSDENSWTLSGDIYKNDEDQTVSPFWQLTPPFSAEVPGEIEVQGGNLLARYNHKISSHTSATLQAYYDYSDREDDFFQQTFTTLDVEAQLQTEVGDKNSLTMGLGYRYTDGEFARSFLVALPDETEKLFNVFIQDELTLIEDTLWLTFGTKWENKEQLDSEWQPSARILWQPAEKHSTWLSLARAVRTPSIIEQSGTVTLATFTTPAGVAVARLLGNENFGSEELIAYEAGYRWQPVDELSFDLAVFYNDYSDLFNVERSGIGFDLVVVNGVSGTGKGAELVAEWNPRQDLSFMLSYSYLHLDLTVDDANNPITLFTDFIETVSPQHQISLRSAYDINEHWQHNFWLRYVDDITARNSGTLVTNSTTPIDSYFILNTNLIWKVNEKMEVMLVAQNLLGEKQLQYISEYSTPPTEIEQSFYGKITWRW